ncbi:hypothetical protein C8R42DRAFT_347969 [Lentinula raphanica]|nr:hypothetical protein C8R42DRAFT_347969 [Lentinula raphanica]
MAFLNRRTTVMTTSSSSNSGHFASSNTSLSLTPSPYSPQRSQSHSSSIMKRVSTMFTPKKKSPQDKSTSASLGIGYEASSMGRKKNKIANTHRDSVRSYRGSSDSDLEDLEEIRQPNDLGPPAPSIYSAVREESEENGDFSTPKKPGPTEQQQKRRRRYSIQSIQSLLSTPSQPPQQPQQAQTAPSLKRRSISFSVRSSLHTKSSSLHSESYAPSLHSLSQSLLEEEAELIQGPKFQTATKVTKVSAVWAGPTRTTSVPNLGSKFVPSTPPQFTLSIRRKPPPRLGLRELPIEILVQVFHLIPRKLVLGLAPLSKNFCRAALVVIYGKLDLRNSPVSRQDKLDALLSRREDLTEITRELICDDSSYPSGFPSALVLARMTHLTTLTLPRFSIDLMQHHTAFGLQSVTFLNTGLTPTEKVELFTWLDGQVNITTLNLPRLFDLPPSLDSPEPESSPAFLSSPSPSYISSHFPLPPSPHNSIFATPQSSPTLAPPTPFQVPLPPSPAPVSPLNSSFRPELASLCAASTLLPNLEVIRAPPSILHLLAPSRTPTIRKVGININDTLVGGLRPAELVGFLKPSSGRSVTPNDAAGEAKIAQEEEEHEGLEELCLNFGKNVDRRTVEKVLGAAGAVFGGSSLSNPEPDSERGRGRETARKVEEPSIPKDGTDSESKQDDQHTPGLQNLEIAIPWNGPRTEEMLYKTIHSILPRYQALCTLVMLLSTSAPEPSPSPQSPSSADTTKDTSYESPIPLPAVQVNGELNADQILVDDTKSEDHDALLSPTETNENSVESQSPHGQSFASSSQVSLVSGGTAPSAGSIVSLTMFPEPPSSIMPIARSSTPNHNEPEATSSFIMSAQTSDSPILSSPITSPGSGKSKNILDRLPSLKKKGKRVATEPIPPLPHITTQFTPNGRSATLPIPIPTSTPSPLTPTNATINTPFVSMSMMPNTPTTPRMSSTPSTPRFSHYTISADPDRFDDDLPSQRYEKRRISSMTTSAVSVSSSIRGVDLNHGPSGNGSATMTSMSSASEPSTPRTPMPDTPTITLTESEKKHVRMWIRQCPTLRKVVFISGAEWGA